MAGVHQQPEQSNYLAKGQSYTCKIAHLIELKYCDDTRPEQQQARATEQHIGLKHAHAQQCQKVSIHTILN